MITSLVCADYDKIKSITILTYNSFLKYKYEHVNRHKNVIVFSNKIMKNCLFKMQMHGHYFVTNVS